MKKIIVLGAGLVGRPMAIDLLPEKEVEVTVADISPDNLKLLTNYPGIKIMIADLSDQALVKSTESSSAS